VKPLTIWSPDEIKSIYNNLLATLSLLQNDSHIQCVLCAHETQGLMTSSLLLNYHTIALLVMYSEFQFQATLFEPTLSLLLHLQWLDLETVTCFLALYDIRLEPKKIATPPVECLSSSHPAQSALEKALTSRELVLFILSPSLIHYFKYLRILFTAAQSCSVGACKY
jgi:hypothetical protein